MSKGSIYDCLRDAHRPPRTDLLLIALAPPNPPPRRFFYYSQFVTPDSLYIETMSVIFHNLIRGVKGERPQSITAHLENNKRLYLKCFQERGFWLQDAVETPLNGAAVRAAIQAGFPRIQGIIKQYAIRRCVLISKEVFCLAGPLTGLGVTVLNTSALPFPGSGHQTGFRSQFGHLLIQNGYKLGEQCH